MTPTTLPAALIAELDALAKDMHARGELHPDEGCVAPDKKYTPPPTRFVPTKAQRDAHRRIVGGKDAP